MSGMHKQSEIGKKHVSARVSENGAYSAYVEFIVSFYTLVLREW